MSKSKKSKRVRAMGRVKTGQTKFSSSFSLTREQKEFLDKQSNSSKLIREIIDDLIAYENAGKSVDTSVIALKHEIDILQAQSMKTNKEFYEYFQAHHVEIWENAQDERGIVYIFDEKGMNVIGEKPATVKQTEEAQYHFKVWKALKEQCDQIQAKIKELKEKIAKS